MYILKMYLFTDRMFHRLGWSVFVACNDVDVSVSPWARQYATHISAMMNTTGLDKIKIHVLKPRGW